MFSIQFQVDNASWADSGYQSHEHSDDGNRDANKKKAKRSPWLYALSCVQFPFDVCPSVERIKIVEFFSIKNRSASTISVQIQHLRLSDAIISSLDCFYKCFLFLYFLITWKFCINSLIDRFLAQEPWFLQQQKKTKIAIRKLFSHLLFLVQVVWLCFCHNNCRNVSNQQEIIIHVYYWSFVLVPSESDRRCAAICWA